MHTVIGLVLLGLILSTTAFGQSQTQDGIETFAPLPSAWHTIVSAYGTLGGYSTSTGSRSLSGYVTLSKWWRDYYTLGYVTLWLTRDDAGGKYYTQHLLSARGSWFVTDRIALAGTYAYLNEGGIQSFSTSAVFHFIGAGGSYWFSPYHYAGATFSLSLSSGALAGGMYRLAHSIDAGAGFWLITSATVTDAEWTPRLFALRQTLSIHLGNDSYIIGSGEIGRRGFFFDDDALVVYNQRTIQTGSVLLKGIIHITSGIYAIPALQYDEYDDYNIKYGSLGLRIVF